MTLLNVLAAVGSMDAPVFTTRDAAARLKVPNGHASVSLARLVARELERLLEEFRTPSSAPA